METEKTVILCESVCQKNQVRQGSQLSFDSIVVTDYCQQAGDENQEFPTLFHILKNSDGWQPQKLISLIRDA